MFHFLLIILVTVFEGIRSSGLWLFQQSDTVQDKRALHFDNTNCTVAVDFTNERIVYPEGVEADRDTTKNFSAEY